MQKVIKLSCYVRNIILFFSATGTAFVAPFNTHEEKIIICGVGKNVAPYLNNMMSKIEKLGSFFKDYRVVMYENNSSDNSAALLHKWAQENSKVIVFSETLTQEQLFHRTQAHALRDQAPCRMELIAYARNIVLKRAMAEELADFKFLVMTDMDFAHGWDINGVLSCFNVPQEWDCLAANSVGGNYTYYDRYAYRDERFTFGPELLGEDFWQELGKYPVQIAPGKSLQPVYSAFGGIAVYKKDSLVGCHYAGVVTQEFEKMMFLLLNYTVAKTHPQLKVYTQARNTNGLVPIQFCANSGYDLPVVCEHSVLHASMILRGYDKIYVNPAMVCHY